MIRLPNGRLRLHIASLFILLTLGACSIRAQAFDLSDLRTQLTHEPSIQGQFTQKRFLQGLPTPIISRGHFTLILGCGLIWRLQSPITQAFRITAHGIDQQLPSGRWAASSQGDMHGESALFLAFLDGDIAALQQRFDLTLQGTAQAWQLHMTPRSAVLRAIFADITLSGHQHLDAVNIVEAQGDHSEVSFHNVSATPPDATDSQALNPS